MEDFIFNSFSNDTEIYPITFFTACARHLQESVRQRVLPFNQIIIILDGIGTLHLNGKNYPLKRGCAVFTTAQYSIGYTNDGGLVSAFITATGPAVEFLSQNFAPEGFLLFNKIDLDKYVSSISHIVSCYKNGYNHGKLSSMTYSLFVDFLSQKQSEDLVPLSKIISYINLHFNEKLCLKMLAEIEYISVSKLCHDFKKYYGCSAFEYIINARLQHAYNLLRNYPDISINDVAVKSGFFDVGYFCRAYRKKYGITPSKDKNSKLEVF